MNTEGFYKKNEDGSWEYAPNFVYAPNFTLLKEEKDSYNYPVEGWSWLDTEPVGYFITDINMEQNIEGIN